MSAVAVFGLGYVGSVTAACLADAGHEVVGVDPDAAKVATLDAGASPVVEPGLAEVVRRARDSGRLRASTDPTAAVGAGVALVCVGTPSRSDGSLELEYVARVASDLAGFLAGPVEWPVVVLRSTVPPGTVEAEFVPRLEAASGLRAGEDFGVATCPEFLREGSGVRDFHEPPFTVVGTHDERSAAAVTELFSFLDAPVHVVELGVAESVKYASNAFHALKVAFANEMGRLLASTGVDARTVMRVFCEDDKLNISPAYLQPGFAFGGSCLPKDLRALVDLARTRNVDVPVMSAILPSNELHQRLVARRVLELGARQVALLGLSFKAETDDLRESPYVELAEVLGGKGVAVRVYDPIVNPSRLTGTNLRYVETHLPHLHRILRTTPEDALEGAELALVGSASPEVVDALSSRPIAHLIDLSGRLGEDLEATSGYEGVAWSLERRGPHR